MHQFCTAINAPILTTHMDVDLDNRPPVYYANYYLLHRHAHTKVIKIVHAHLHFAVNMWICVVLLIHWLISLLRCCFIHFVR